MGVNRWKRSKLVWTWEGALIASCLIKSMFSCRALHRKTDLGISFSMLYMMRIWLEFLFMNTAFISVVQFFFNSTSNVQVRTELFYLHICELFTHLYFSSHYLTTGHNLFITAAIHHCYSHEEHINTCTRFINCVLEFMANADCDSVKLN